MKTLLWPAAALNECMLYMRDCDHSSSKTELYISSKKKKTKCTCIKGS